MLSAKNQSGDIDKFRDFMRKLTVVPLSELKARIDVEKETNQKPKGGRPRLTPLDAYPSQHRGSPVQAPLGRDDRWPPKRKTPRPDNSERGAHIQS